MNNKIAIITSRFNEEITRELKAGALSQLTELGFLDAQIAAFDVPGAVEIPLIAKQLAKQKQLRVLGEQLM